MTATKIAKRWDLAKKQYESLKDVGLDVKVACLVKQLSYFSSKEDKSFTEIDEFNLCLCKLIIDELNSIYQKTCCGRQQNIIEKGKTNE